MNKLAYQIPGMFLTVALLAPVASAYESLEPAVEYYDYAQVVEVKPVYSIVRSEIPQQRCWKEQRVHYHRAQDPGPTLLGAVIGGAVGHQFGKGRGNRAATMAGAIIGASIGNDVGRNNARASEHVSQERICRDTIKTVEEERLDGYQVTYRYRGARYTTLMQDRPGARIKMRVHAEPVE